MDKLDIDTPALLLDLPTLERNIYIMAEYFEGKSASLRPHIKTHKTPTIALMQLEAGAKGITCQKLGEAEVMAAAGINDLLISNQILGKVKIERLVKLAGESKVIVAVDSIKNVEDLSKAASKGGVEIGALVEVDVGMGRCGVPPGKPALKLSQRVLKSRGLMFRGLMGYEGHCVFIESFEKRREECHRANRLLVDTQRMLEDAGIDVEVVSAGGTGTYNMTGEYPGITEVQAGSYATMDLKYGSIEGIGGTFEYAVTVLATVISRPANDRAIIDAGMKAITMEFGMPQPRNLKNVELIRLSEEHGALKLKSSESNLREGDRIELIPTHGCTTINLHDRFHVIKDDRVEAMWEISARGKCQ